jgi:uncharacterized protein
VCDCGDAVCVSHYLMATFESESFDSTTVSVEHRPLDSSKIISGNPTTGNQVIGITESMKTGVWEHSIGVSTDEEAEEIFVVLAGKGRVVLENGNVMLLAPGVVGKFRAGEKTRWEIDEPLRKVWVIKNE